MPDTSPGDTHPAVIAWRAIDPAAPVAWIETLKAQKSKSTVYRLHLTARSPIVAKRCRWDVAVHERDLYRDVLPRLSIPTVRQHGWFPEPDRQCAWLFLEDAGDNEYDPALPIHRRLAAEWLGELHTAAPARVNGRLLPPRGPEFYLAQASAVRQAIADSASNPALSDHDRHVLGRIDQCLGYIESRRARIESDCTNVPRTLVHGDFVSKNIRLRTDGGRTELIALDWETSGWGIPAADLCRFVGAPAKPDLVRYHEILSDRGVGITMAEVEALAALGGVFRMIAAMYWASLGLTHPWVDKCMIWMRAYHDDMGAALRATEWGLEYTEGDSSG